MTPPPHLRAVGITKRFGLFTAVDDVSLDLPPGSFHALLGENGAGKSTLVKCLMGFHAADSGEIRLNGASAALSSPRAARLHGIGMVFQHFTLIPSMTVAENLVLARPDLPATIDWPSERTRLSQFLSGAPFHVDLDSRIAELSAGQKQKVEILKELYLQTRVLILDEPTSVLTAAEADEILGFLRRLVDRGELSVLLITHKFREVQTFADSVTVLRRGRFAGGGSTRTLDAAGMAEMMMGEARAERRIGKTAGEPGAPRLCLDNLCAVGDNGLEAAHGVSLTVRAGEIVGIAGVSGNGQRELLEVIAGQRAASSGRITVDHQTHLPSREMIRRHRFFVLPEEPLRNASVAGMTVAENIALRLFDQPPFQRSGFLTDPASIREFAVRMIRRFSIRPEDPDAKIESLSGGNVQRAVLARELSGGDVGVLVAANPCFGLDFKAVDFIHDRIVETRNKGAAILLISEDLDELLDLADRVFVMSGGRLVHETTPAAADLAEIGARMAGHH